MTHETGNGLTKEQWREVFKRAGWLRFGLMVLATAISFAAIGGAYVTIVDTRIESNETHLERVDATILLHRERIAAAQASQAATETAAARLEERIAAQAETLRAQGESLHRIETLLQELLSRGYRIPADERGNGR